MKIDLKYKNFKFKCECKNLFFVSSIIEILTDLFYYKSI